MSFVKKLGRVLTASLFKLCLLVFTFSFAFSSTLGTPEPIKDSLDKSGLFDKVVPSLLESINKDKPEGEGGPDQIPIDNPEIQAIINKSFSPELLQSSTDSFLDGMFSWLNGDSSEPSFSIDLTSAKNDLVLGIANYAEARLLSLPPCSAAEARQLAGQDVNPFTVTCRPPIVVSQEKQKLIDEFNGAETEFLKDPVINADDLKGDDQDKFNQDLKGLPDQFQIIKALPKVSAVVGVLSAAALILLHDDKRRGVRQVLLATLITGLFLLVSTLILQFIFDKLTTGNGLNIDSQTLKDAFIDALGRLFNKFNRAVMVVSAAYAAVGGLGLGTLWLLNRKNSPAEHSKEESPSTEHKKDSDKEKEPTEKQ